MPRKRYKRPTWFRVQLTSKPIVDAYPDKDVGRALKLAMRYFNDQTMPNDDESAMVIALFLIFKEEIDSRNKEYENAVVNGKMAYRLDKGTASKEPTTSEHRSVSKPKRFAVFERDKFTCQYCGRSAPNVILEVDHIIPLSGGGNNDIGNLVTSCEECNRGKGSKKLGNG